MLKYNEVFMKKSKKIKLSTSHIIMLSFLSVILVGTLLLMLPISARSGEATPFIDALFTSTTATCVTGLVTLPTFSHWSVFGQIVLLVLIQVGGLGVITVMSGVMIALQKRIGLGNRLLIQDAFNLNSLSGIVKFVKKVIIGTLIVEGAGALLYMTVFIPKYGALGIWYALFNSISAFCNAGIDILGPDSLVSFATNPIVNLVTCALIIIGGVGYIVWWDILRIMKEKPKKPFLSLSLHSKIVIVSTLLLTFIGALLVFLLEYSNPETLGALNLFDKIQVSFFQSVTTRTAGFFSVPQELFRESTSIISIVLMFIGGSPVGTAGGVKTVTVIIVATSAIAAIRSKEQTVLFGRGISKESLGKALGVIFMAISIIITSSVLLSAVTPEADAINIIYEAVSATSTVGLTRGVTPMLNNAGKLIVAATMYLGRIGPISLAIAFNIKKTGKNLISHPTEEISVG